MAIVADSPAIAAPTGRNRLVLVLQSFRAAAMDAVAHLGTATDRRALALAADALHDRYAEQLVYGAALGAQEAEVKGCGCAQRFDRLISLGRGVQQADAVEDGHYDASFAEVGNGQKRVRQVATTAERLISGRSS